MCSVQSVSCGQSKYAVSLEKSRPLYICYFGCRLILPIFGRKIDTPRKFEIEVRSPLCLNSYVHTVLCKILQRFLWHGPAASNMKSPQESQIFTLENYHVIIAKNLHSLQSYARANV